MPMQHEKSKNSLVYLLLTLIIVVAVGALIFFQRYAIHDWWRLRSYAPSAEIVALANDTTMDDDARRVFYAYHPSIEPREDFNMHCGDGELTIVLGCYSSVGGIHIFEVDDERLDGIMQVTAAHEFLHAAYERLSSSERQRIDQLTKEVHKNLTDERILETIQAYNDRDSSVVPNELHSILGTEVADLPDELEEYYGRYFDDRSRIVQFSQSYESAFTSRKEEAKQHEARLATLRQDIDDEKQALSAEYARLNNESSAISSLNSNIEVGEVETLNQRIDAYNMAIREYNTRAKAVSSLVDEYNALYEQYKRVVLEQQDLFNSIDSRPKAID